MSARKWNLGYLVILAVAFIPRTTSGQLTVRRSPRPTDHFLSVNGAPILLVGDSVTQGWMECGLHFDQRAYVHALAERGINLLMIWAYKGTNREMQRNDARIGYDAPELWPWAGSPDDRNFDLQRFNPAYFARLRELVACADANGIVVLITIHDGWPKTCFAGHPFNRTLGNGPLAQGRDFVALADYRREMPEPFDATWDWRQQNQYFQERFSARVIAELREYRNVMYEMFNEGEWYDREQRDRHEQHFLAFFRARCPNVLLSNSDHIAADDPHQDPKVDVVTLHPKDWVGHFPLFARGFHETPVKPYLYSEPVPEFDGEHPALDDVRRSVWETTLAGAGWVNQNDPSFGWDQRAAISARADARDRAYDIAGRCLRFFRRGGVRFWEMKPQGSLSSTGVCLAKRGREYVVYASTGGSFTVDLSGTQAAAWEVRWYDPRSGTFHAPAAVCRGHARTEFTSPFPGDAVLHLRRVSE
jgi:hypothetical protein